MGWISISARFALALVLGLATIVIDPTPEATSSVAARSPTGAATVYSLGAISCPSIAVCYAVGDQGAILATHDAGATWQRQISGTKSPLDTVDCPTVSVCFVLVGVPCNDSVDRPLLTTSDGGSTWTKLSLPPGCSGPGPACPRVTTCYIRVSPPQPGVFFRTTDGGRSWQERGRIAPTIGIGGPLNLVCPSTTACYSGGWQSIGRSANGAKTWTISQFLVRGSWCTSEFVCLSFGAMACPSQSICYAGGCCGGTRGANAVVATTRDGGQTWRRHLIPLPRLGRIGALSCPTPSVCFALGQMGRIATTMNGGDSWPTGR